MAKTTERDLFETLRARGLRKKAASNLASAFGRADGSPPGRAAHKAIDELRDLVSDLEARAKGGRATDRRAAAKKAATTRKSKANQRSRAAKKAAQTRAKAK